MKIEQKGDRLVITDFDQFEAYKIAARIEKDGIEFYQHLAKKTSDLQARNTLELLATEEARHLQIFELFLSEARKLREDNTEDNDLLDSLDFGIFKVYQSIDELENILKDTKRAIKLGMGVEDKSIEFYLNCNKYISSEATKAQLYKIVEEEKRHKQLLEEMLKAV